MYPIGYNCSMRAATGKTPLWFVWTLAVVLLASAGITYRVLAAGLKRIVDTAITLPVPLSAFPSQIGNWVGKDLSIPNITKEYMEKNFADDFVSRRYVNSVTKAWADVYIVYCSSRPGPMFISYIARPAQGAYWVIDLGCAIPDMAGSMMVQNPRNLFREPADKYLV